MFCSKPVTSAALNEAMLVLTARLRNCGAGAAEVQDQPIALDRDRELDFLHRVFAQRRNP